MKQTIRRLPERIRSLRKLEKDELKRINCFSLIKDSLMIFVAISSLIIAIISYNKTTVRYEATVRKDSINQAVSDTYNNKILTTSQKQLNFLNDLIEQNNILSKPIITVAVPSFKKEMYDWVDNYNSRNVSHIKLSMNTRMQNVGKRTTHVDYFGILLNYRYEVSHFQIKDHKTLLPTEDQEMHHVFYYPSEDEYKGFYYCLKIIYIDTLLNRKECVYKMMGSIYNPEMGIKYISILGGEKSKEVASAVTKYMKKYLPEFGDFESTFETTVEKNNPIKLN